MSKIHGAIINGLNTSSHRIIISEVFLPVHASLVMLLASHQELLDNADLSSLVSNSNVKVLRLTSINPIISMAAGVTLERPLLTSL